jgi:hypothetical protein
MKKDYYGIADSIIKKYDLGKYIDILLDYWAENPTTLGHGFYHVISVAVESYELAVENNYPRPEHLFIAGVFHDIYRPAEGIDGGEDQSKGAEVVKDLFEKNSISQEISEKIVGAILSHDGWRGSDNVPQLDLILSVGDKICNNTVAAYGYVWSSNDYMKKLGQPPVYKNYFDPLYSFIKYQVRAWEIFKKHPIKGTERAIDSYLKIVDLAAKNYYNAPDGKPFEQYATEKAEECRQEEKDMLEKFGVEEEKIKKIMRRYY